MSERLSIDSSSQVKPDSSGNGSSPHFSSPAGSCASASDSRVLSPAAAGGSTAVMNNFCPSVTNDLNPEQMEYGSYMGAGGNSADHSNIMNPLPIARAVANYEFPPTSLENDLINSFTGCYSPAPVAQHSHHMSAPEPLTIEPLEHTNVMAGVQDPMIHSAPASFVYYTEPSNFNSDPFALEGFVDKQRYTMADGRCTMQDQQHQHNSDALQQSLFVETYQDADVKCQMNEQMQNHTAINNSHYSNQNNLAVVPYDTGVNSFPYTITTNGTDVHVDPVLHSGNRNLLLSAEPVNGGIVSNQMLQGGDVHPNCMPMGHDHVNNAGQMLSGLGNLIEQQQTHMACGQQNLVDPMVDLHHYTNLSSTAGANQPGSFEPTGSLFTDLDETIMNTTADLVGEYHTNAGMNDFDDPELASLFSLSYGGFEPPQACAAGTSSQYYQYGSNFVDQNSEKNEALRKRHFTAPGAISMSKFPTSGKPMKPLSPKGRKRHKVSDSCFSLIS